MTSKAVLCVSPPTFKPNLFVFASSFTINITLNHITNSLPPFQESSIFSASLDKAPFLGRREYNSPKNACVQDINIVSNYWMRLSMIIVARDVCRSRRVLSAKADTAHPPRSP